MATPYAHAVRLRCLALPWNFAYYGALRNDPCPALSVMWQLLRPVGQFPAEHWHRTYASSVIDQCFYCKKAVPKGFGLVANCPACTSSRSTATDSGYIRIYQATLEIATASWTLEQRQTSMPSLTGSNLMAPVAASGATAQLALPTMAAGTAVGQTQVVGLTRQQQLAKLRKSALIRLTKRTGG